MSSKNNLLNHLVLTLVAFVCLVIVISVYNFGWFYHNNENQITTGTNIITPHTFYVGAGNNDDISNLNMGNIDTSNEEVTSVAYVFCVVGKPASNYIIQLAYTTNIPFTYYLYSAELLPVASSETTYTSYDKKTYNLTQGIPDSFDASYVGSDDITYYFSKKESISLNALNLDDGSTSANDTYTDKNYGLYKYFQVNANPVYTQSNTIEMGKDELSTGVNSFEHYYILVIDWSDKEIINDKEVDLIYLTVSISE